MSPLAKKFLTAALAAFIAGMTPILLATIDPSLKDSIMPAWMTLALLGLAGLFAGVAWRVRGTRIV